MSSLTHAHDGGLVVFHIGMTIRRPHRPDLWMPVFAAMPRMLAELSRNKEASARGEAEDLGFLGAETLVGAKGPWVVQYWRSVEHLYAYAGRQDLAHVPAWRAFNTRARAHPDAVGIWHETYVVDRAETIYVATPPMGLPKATSTVPVGARHDRAAARVADGRTPARAATDSAQ